MSMLCLVCGEVYDRLRCCLLILSFSSGACAISTSGTGSTSSSSGNISDCSSCVRRCCELSIGVGKNASGVLLIERPDPESGQGGSDSCGTDESAIAASCSFSVYESCAGACTGTAIACVMHGTLLLGVQKYLRCLPLVSCR